MKKTLMINHFPYKQIMYLLRYQLQQFIRMQIRSLNNRNSNENAHELAQACKH